MQLIGIILFNSSLLLSLIPVSCSKRFIFDNQSYGLTQYNFLYDEYNKIDYDIYFFYNENLDRLLDDENVEISEAENEKYEICKLEKNRNSFELIKIDLMIRDNGKISKILSNNPNCYFFFKYDLVRFEKYSGNPRVLYFPVKPVDAYREYSQSISSYMNYNEINNHRLLIYLDQKMEKNISITILTDLGKTYSYMLKKEQLFNID
jgi:hypothetical protein